MSDMGEKMNEKEEEYSSTEMMVIQAAREIKNGELVYAGIGLPVLATTLAMKTHAPNVALVFEAGGLRSDACATLPLTVDDFGTFVLSDAALGMYSSMGLLSRGEADVTFIGGIQVDKYGNVNSTLIGDFARPETAKVMLPGSGGASPMAVLGKRVLIIMPHQKRKLVEKLDYLTSPGWFSGSDTKGKFGYSADRGPSSIITSMGVLRFDKHTREAYLDGYYRGVTVDQVRENTGWDLKVSPDVREISSPTEEELTALRDIDKARLYY
jgi:glutaconate CoA-transferase subunit B